ncbi:MAG: TIR domain-containing protein [Cyanobacteria bacterium P01_G01_bin.38]
MHRFQDAFISYGRADSKQFAKHLNDRLVEAGLEVWFDFDDIPLGVDYQNQINDGIEQADNFLFIISPHSVNSDYCAKEIELALALNKRIIPLLHVEEVSLETWQQRNPYDNQADWQAYRDQGFHSSFPNMHPEISKINWVYFREGLDDFEVGLAGLKSILARQQGYVRQHTLLLDRALEWQRHQRQPPYLLTGESLSEAKTWLNTRFREEQPPCLPTDLHCEFITESLKGADDQMTQIFVSYSEDDIKIQEKIRRRLVREGFTVWINTQDIQTAEDFQGAINRGIEKADNIVLLLSPNSLASKYCRQEIDYGCKYHKRIIPLLVKHTDLETLPVDLRTLQFIDFSTLASETHFDRAVDELIRALAEAADYANQHKRLLVKALAWERQGRDRKFLLRGTAFAEAQAWLAQAVPTNLIPTDLHETYLQASAGGNQFYDAFISYGRADSKAFATQLYEQLSAQGLQVWFDQNDIPMGVDYQQQIDDGIEKAHNFLFIIAPHSVNSPYCAKEIELAVQLNKRILPILHVEEISYSTWKARNPGKGRDAWQRDKSQGKHASEPNMHPSIRKINWVKAQTDDVEAVLTELRDLIHRHEGYVQQHTELLIRALAWERHQRQVSYLLMGEDRLNAQAWLTKRFENEQPPCLPTQLHAEFITESTKAADGGMTQVFISYAQENRQVKEQVRRHLLQAGITVWTDTVDIYTGEDFEAAIRRGIEEADNIVYLISKPALKSAYCQQEIKQALSLNKRIIPILLEELDLSQLTEEVKTIQFINLADNQVSLDLEEDLAKLLRTIRQEAPYYDQHKHLLVQALKWQRQKQNSSLLLQRQALKKYTAWAQIAKNRPLQKALPLQLQFLEASQAQPPEQTLGVFISHHVDDVDFSHRLNDTLLIQGKSTWFSPGGAEADAETPQDTRQAIDNAENFVFLLSPSSVRSEACLAELTYAQLRQKRIVPVIYRDVLKSTLPEGLESISWSDFRQHEGDFLVNFGELFRTLESDPEHVRSHTRLLVKATEWDAASRDDSFLLRGKDLAASEQWLQQSVSKVPQPAELQRDYIQASQALPFKKIKVRTVAMAAALTTVFVSAIRLLGGLQPLEARIYDQFLQLRPSEAEPDERLLIVKVDGPSGEWLRDQMVQNRYARGIGTIPDEALNEALEILEDHDARLIGLDFFRDFPADEVLVGRLSQTANLFGICQTATSQEVTEIHSEEIPPAQVGFGDLLQDGSRIVRRHPLKVEDPASSGCVAQESFSLLLATTYLETEGVTYQDPYEETDVILPMQLGDTVVPELYGNGSIYSSKSVWRDWSDLAGYQTLLNFRVYGGELKNFAEQVSLDALLRNEVSPELIRDRIVLIGYTDFSDRNTDDFNTPYGDSVPGVYLHGQMISQLINAALEDRPLIRWWPFWGETGWILLWSGAGGLVFWRVVRPGRVLAASLGSVGLLSLACYGFLVGPVIWVPWVPALLGGSITGGAIGYMTYRLRKG